MRPWTRLQDWGTLIAGLYAALSPIWVSTTGERDAFWALIVLGALLAVTALFSLALPASSPPSGSPCCSGCCCSSLRGCSPTPTGSAPRGPRGSSGRSRWCLAASPASACRPATGRAGRQSSPSHGLLEWGRPPTAGPTRPPGTGPARSRAGLFLAATDVGGGVQWRLPQQQGEQQRGDGERDRPPVDDLVGTGECLQQGMHDGDGQGPQLLGCALQGTEVDLGSSAGPRGQEQGQVVLEPVEQDG